MIAVPLISTLRTDVRITAAQLVGSHYRPGAGGLSVTVVKHLPTSALLLPNPLPDIVDGGVPTPARSDIAYLLVRVTPECEKDFPVDYPRLYLSYDVGAEPSIQEIIYLPSAPGFSGRNWLETWTNYACHLGIAPPPSGG